MAITVVEVPPPPQSSPANRATSRAAAGRSLYQWMVGRSHSIGAVFSRIKKQTLRLPRMQDARPFIDDFTCVVAEYDDHRRAVRYTHPEHQPDDALHAVNYALLIALRAVNSPMCLA